MMDTNFLKAHAERCRSLAENADEFTKRRLLDLAAHYDKRLKAAGRSILPRCQSKSEPRFPGWKIGRRFATVPQQQPVRTSNATNTKIVALWKGDTLKGPCFYRNFAWRRTARSLDKPKPSFSIYTKRHQSDSVLHG
jgi:hypothetical protein